VLQVYVLQVCVLQVYVLQVYVLQVYVLQVYVLQVCKQQDRQTKSSTKRTTKEDPNSGRKQVVIMNCGVLVIAHFNKSVISNFAQQVCKLIKRSLSAWHHFTGVR